MNIVIVFPSVFTNEHTLAKVIQKLHKGIKGISIEGNCILCETGDVTELATELSKMFGIERVAIATKVSSNFSELSAAIVEAGSRIIIPGDRFFVKVTILPFANFSYMSRDIEFACTGSLAARLTSMDALPAKTEAEASRLILTIVGKDSAYICIKIIGAPGGLIAGSRGKAVGSIHSSLSFLSCLMAAKAGFDCTSIVLPYANDSDLKINARLAQHFALRTGRKKQTIFATAVKLPAKGILSALLIEKIVSKILIQCQGKIITFPITAAVHPIWFIESIIQDAVFAGKIPITPMISLSSELGNYAKEVGINMSISAPKITKDKLQKYSNAIESEARSAIKHIKKLELEVGPNYFHDIIDSI
ncbi:MAG: hypothetical protein M3263_01885 [Thermoproteota archaeon]|nr:hypothetical protein [Thermoproteota archaeon]MDQ5876145.1 hypothetical protein [Thermoproteota archaeon]